MKSYKEPSWWRKEAELAINIIIVFIGKSPWTTFTSYLNLLSTVLEKINSNWNADQRGKRGKEERYILL